MPYQHFTPESRNQLSALLRARVMKKDMAKILGKDRTSIWRERKRNFDSSTLMNYDAGNATSELLAIEGLKPTLDLGRLKIILAWKK